MTQVDFYILDGESDSERFRLAARIAEKATQRDQTVYINTEDAHTAAKLDEVLWTFSQSSFLPHRVIATGAPEQTTKTAAQIEPVLIGTNIEIAAEPWQVMINLAGEIPAFFSRYERVAEVIDAHETRRRQGRERYKYYRDRGYQLKTHNV